MDPVRCRIVLSNSPGLHVDIVDTFVCVCWSAGDGDEGDDMDGSTAEAASGSPNEHLESRRGHPHLPLSDHRSENDVTADRHIGSRRSAVHPSRLSSDQGRSVTSEVVQAGEGSSQKVEFLGGEVVWAKFARFPWWPAMVQNEEDLNEDFKGDKPAEHNIACLGGPSRGLVKI